MTLPRPSVRGLSMRFAAASMVVVLWLPFVNVGRQPYRAGEFVSRIDELANLTVIDGAWALPARLVLVAAVIGALATLSWGRYQRWLTLATAICGCAATVLAYRLSAGSDLLSASSGTTILAIASVAALALSVLKPQARSAPQPPQPLAAASRLPQPPIHGPKAQQC